MADILPALAALRRAGSTLLDAVLPPRCLACGITIGRGGSICADCWRELAFISAPICACCGYPFEYAVDEPAFCGACLQGRPAFDRARAVLCYDDLSRPLVLGFKYGDRTNNAPAFGTLMARAGAELLADADWLVPVPLHWRRLWARRYNQAALLAHAVERASGVPVMVDALKRRKATAPLGHMSPAARRRGLRGAFALRPERRDALAGRRVVLIDDVLTTGATAEACARVLKRRGVASVDLLVLARVVRSGTAWEGR